MTAAFDAPRPTHQSPNSRRTAGDRLSPVAPPRQSKALRFLAIAGVSVLAVLAGWQVARHTLAHGLAASHPEWALALNPRQPEALLTLVERVLDDLIAKRLAAATDAQKSGDQSRTPQPPLLPQPAQVETIVKLRSMSRQALAIDPVSARAVRILAQLAELEQDDVNALQLSAIAARRSKHEPVAIFRTARSAFERRDYAAALDHGDVLLRTQPELASFVYPMLASLAETPEAKDLLIARLLQAPLWRDQFIASILPSITDARTPLRLMLALQAAGHKPTPGDLRGYLNFLIDRQLPQIAYYAWLQFLSPEELAKVRTVNNGRFTEPVTGLPFSWTLRSGAGAAVEISQISPAENALRTKFNQGRAELGDISQVLLLSPGKYEFSARLKGELIGRRGLKWMVACLATPAAPLGETEMFIGKAPTWRELKFTLDVPANGCPAQRLRLVLDARSDSERLVTGDVLFTGIEINRQ